MSVSPSEAFLRQSDAWSDALAADLASRNPSVAPDELHGAVRRIISRAVFLRLCEDRGLEPCGQLRSAADDPDADRRLAALFRRAGHRYRSGLFFDARGRGIPRGGPAPALRLRAGPVREFIRRLCSPDCPCDLSALPADILGLVHQRHLGRTTGATKAGRRSSVRRAGGVYYTPAHLVDAVVSRTVGELLEGRTPREVEREKLRVLDPACGAGSFLIGAYRRLLEWHRERYLESGPERLARGPRPRVRRGASGAWRLTVSEKARILREHIFGVDLDPQAVELARLSLVLVALDREESDCAGKGQRRPSQAAPELSGNLKCGDALVGPDFHTGREAGLLFARRSGGVNAFDWPREFPAVLRDFCSDGAKRPEGRGSFDAVIGNPPWGQKGVDWDPAVKAYLRAKYPASRGILDLFRPFVEQGIGLLRRGGMWGMVLPDVVLLKDYPETRLFLLRSLTLTWIQWWGTAFEGAVIDAVTIAGRKEPAASGHRVRVRVDDPKDPVEHDIPQDDFLANPRHTFNLRLTPEKRAVLSALDRLPRLADYFEVHEGVHSGNLRAELFVGSRQDGSCRPLYFGREELAPFRLQWKGRYLRLDALPAARSAARYANVGRPDWHERSKVLVRRTGDRVTAAVDELAYYASNNFFLVFPKSGCSLDLYGLCAVLNSRLVTWCFRTVEPRRGRAFAELKIKHLGAFPLPAALARPGGCARLNLLGRRRAAEAGRLAAAASPWEEEASLRAARDLDAAIEEWVLSSLGLTEELRARVRAMSEN